MVFDYVRKRVLARAIKMDEEIGGNHAYFRDN